MNINELLLLIFLSIGTATIGAGQLLTDWKFHDRRTKASRRLRLALIIGVICIGLTQLALSISARIEQTQLNKSITGMQAEISKAPSFILYVNNKRVDTNEVLRVQKTGNHHPLQISFVNLGSKSATDVLVSVLGAMNHRNVPNPWRVSQGIGIEDNLRRFGPAFFSYTMTSPVHKDVFFELPPLYFDSSRSNAYASVQIKCTEKAVSWWDINVILE